MSISIAGINTFQVGDVVTQYQVSTDGSIGLDGYDAGPTPDPVSQGVRDLLAQAHTNLFENAFRDVTQRAVNNDQLLKSALGAVPPLTTVFPNSYIGSQLAMIAKLIGARNALGLRRQVFFCAMDGFDTHGAQMDSQSSLLADLSQSMSAFYSATVELGVDSSVTTFTASDFGRTFTSNGGGSDHGWGNHHFIMGGGIKGGDIYGTYPTLAVDGPDDTEQGRWIPTTAVDEYSATLAGWFGVSANDLPAVLPNIGPFANTNLGFTM